MQEESVGTIVTLTCKALLSMISHLVDPLQVLTLQVCP